MCPSTSTSRRHADPTVSGEGCHKESRLGAHQCCHFHISGGSQTPSAKTQFISVHIRKCRKGEKGFRQTLSKVFQTPRQQSGIEFSKQTKELENGQNNPRRRAAGEHTRKPETRGTKNTGAQALFFQAPVHACPGPVVQSAKETRMVVICSRADEFVKGSRSAYTLRSKGDTGVGN